MDMPHVAMPPAPVVTVDLSLPPERRWEPIFSWGTRIGRLLSASGGPTMAALAARDDVMGVLQRLVPADYLAEFRALADATGMDLRALLLGNATYDLQKFGIGCSSFAVDAPGAPLHARNLDWFAPDDVLAKETLSPPRSATASSPSPRPRGGTTTSSSPPGSTWACARPR